MGIAFNYIILFALLQWIVPVMIILNSKFFVFTNKYGRLQNHGNLFVILGFLPVIMIAVIDFSSSLINLQVIQSLLLFTVIFYDIFVTVIAFILKKRIFDVEYLDLWISLIMVIVTITMIIYTVITGNPITNVQLFILSPSINETIFRILIILFAFIVFGWGIPVYITNYINLFIFFNLKGRKVLKLNFQLYKYISLIGVVLGLFYLSTYSFDNNIFDSDFRARYYSVLSVFHVIIAAIYIPWIIIRPNGKQILSKYYQKK